MGCRTQGNTPGDLVFQPEDLTQGRAQNTAHDACNDHRCGGQSPDATCPLCQGLGHGGGHAFGQQADGDIMVKAKEGAQPPDQQQTAGRACGNTCQDSPQVVFQLIQLGIQRDAQADGTGGKQPGDALHALLIYLVGDARNQQHGNDDHRGHHDGVKQSGLGFPVEPDAKLVGGNGKQQCPVGRAGEEFSHGPSPFGSAAGSRCPPPQTPPGWSPGR